MQTPETISSEAALADAIALISKMYHKSSISYLRYFGNVQIVPHIYHIVKQVPHASQYFCFLIQTRNYANP